MTDRTVFISNLSKAHNYEPAKSYGALRAITSGNYPIFKTTRLREEIVTALVCSQPDDYLLLSGSSVIAGLAMATWLIMHGKVNLLLYDRTERAYVLRHFQREDTQKEIEAAHDRLEEESV